MEIVRPVDHQFTTSIRQFLKAAGPGDPGKPLGNSLLRKIESPRPNQGQRQSRILTLMCASET